MGFDGRAVSLAGAWDRWRRSALSISDRMTSSVIGFIATLLPSVRSLEGRYELRQESSQIVAENGRAHAGLTTRRGHYLISKEVASLAEGLPPGPLQCPLCRITWPHRPCVNKTQGKRETIRDSERDRPGPAADFGGRPPSAPRSESATTANRANHLKIRRFRRIGSDKRIADPLELFGVELEDAPSIA